MILLKHMGYLGAQDTYEVGNVKGGGAQLPKTFVSIDM